MTPPITESPTRAAATAPGEATPRSGPRTLGEMLLNATEHHTGIALEYERGGHLVQIAYPDLGTIVTEIARGLIALGIQQGDRVAILGATSAEWTMADYGALCAGAVVTPIYHTNSAEECAYVLAHSGARLVFCEDGAQAAKVEAIRDRCPALKQVVLFDGAARRRSLIAPAAQTRPRRDREVGASPPPGDRPGRHRNARLHLGHHRAPQGLHAHACQLPRGDSDVCRPARD